VATIRKRSLEIDLIKGRIAEALVESIFRRALFKMTRFGKESDLRGMLKVGKDEDFAPDFLALKESLVAESAGVYHTFMIEVKYRKDLSRYLAQQSREGNESVFAKSKAKWPNLFLVFVTDHPEEGRSCFQALSMNSYEPGAPVKTAELHEIEQFRIFPNNAKEHEELAKQIFGLVSGFRQETASPDSPSG
jgi:hypothetical protein